MRLGDIGTDRRTKRATEEQSQKRSVSSSLEAGFKYRWMKTEAAAQDRAGRRQVVWSLASAPLAATKHISKSYLSNQAFENMFASNKDCSGVLEGLKLIHWNCRYALSNFQRHENANRRSSLNRIYSAKMVKKMLLFTEFGSSLPVNPLMIIGRNKSSKNCNN